MVLWPGQWTIHGIQITPAVLCAESSANSWKGNGSCSLAMVQSNTWETQCSASNFNYLCGFPLVLSFHIIAILPKSNGIGWTLNTSPARHFSSRDFAAPQEWRAVASRARGLLAQGTSRWWHGLGHRSSSNSLVCGHLKSQLCFFWRIIFAVENQLLLCSVSHCSSNFDCIHVLQCYNNTHT